MVGASGAAPSWSLQPPADTEQELRFVGRAVGDNILDERLMRSRAMEDARAQIASRIATRIWTESADYLKERGAAHLGQDKVQRAEYVRRVHTRVKQQVHGVRLDGNYWEKWRIDPGLFSRAFTRYKYAILAGYPRAEYERKIEKYVRLGQDQRRAHELIDQGRPRAAAELLEALLNDFPDAPVSANLVLADAYRAAGLLTKADDVLGAALERATPEEQPRVRQKMDEIAGEMPDFSGASALVVVEAEGPMAALGGDLTWLESLLLRANIAVREVKSGAIAQSPPLLREARRAGAGWLITVLVREVSGERTRTIYDIKIEKGSAEAAVRILDASTGEILASATALQRHASSGRDTALRAAGKTGVRKALRYCLVNLLKAEEKPQ
ncbi:MAG: tetratricopeptide repeat protein [Planctomycetes bacterium]|nr:tetratricopeptide repeat protein [Planctomycetota bacterium]